LYEAIDAIDDLGPAVSKTYDTLQFPPPDTTAEIFNLMVEALEIVGYDVVYQIASGEMTLVPRGNDT
jgi:hypothetical protein